MDNEEQLINLRYDVLHGQRDLRIELQEAKIRLESIGLEVRPETFAAVKAMIDSLYSALSRNADIALFATAALRDVLDVRKQSSQHSDYLATDAAMKEWLGFHLEILAGEPTAAMRRIIGLIIEQPEAALQVIPTELFRNDYRGQFDSIARDLRESERKLDDLKTLRKSMSESPTLKILRVVYYPPLFAFESLLQILDPPEAMRRRLKAIPFKDHWQSRYKQQSEKFEKEIQRRGLITNQKYREMSNRYNEKISRLTAQKGALLGAVRSECEEALARPGGGSRVPA